MKEIISETSFTEQSHYEQIVRSRLRDLRRTSEEWTLQNVLPRMRGAAPELVVRLCPDLATSARLQIAPPMRDHFEAHPLDYDWRFLPETVASLADRLSNLATEFILMGTPSLLTPLRGLGVSVTLYDRNPAVTDATVVDFASLVSKHNIPAKSACVVLDAPWYPHDLMTWINFAIRQTPSIDTLLFSLWPELTRPTASDERLYILKWLQKFGVVDVIEDDLAYDVPLFERLAYSEQRIALNFNWRKGDLVIFKPKRRVEIASFPHAAHGKVWRRYLIGKRQIAVQERPILPGPVKMLPLGGPSGWHLNTVSRRDARRNRIEFWTSNDIAGRVFGNRVVMAALDEFFGEKKRFDALTNEQQHVLNLLSDLNGIALDNRQAFVTWRHQG